MKKQIAFVLISGVVLMAALLAWANTAGPSGELVSRILGAVLIVGLPLAVQLIKRTQQKRTLVQAEGSVEGDLSIKAQSAAYVDALVILVLALAVVALFGNSLFAVMVMLSATALLIVSFWVRYHMVKRAVLADAIDEESHS